MTARMNTARFPPTASGTVASRKSSLLFGERASDGAGGLRVNLARSCKAKSARTKPEVKVRRYGRRKAYYKLEALPFRYPGEQDGANKMETKETRFKMKTDVTVAKFVLRTAKWYNIYMVNPLRTLTSSLSLSAMAIASGCGRR